MTEYMLWMGDGSLICTKDGNRVQTVTREAESKLEALAAFKAEIGVRTCPKGYVMARAIKAKAVEPPTDARRVSLPYRHGMARLPESESVGTIKEAMKESEARPLPTGPTFPLPSDDA